MQHGYRMIGALAVVMFMLTQSGLAAETTIADNAYAMLDAVRIARSNQLASHIDRLHALAKSVIADENMRDYFLIKQSYHRLQLQEAPPQEAIEQIEMLKRHMQEYYLEHYQHFYDILFVDTSGFVFSTIRHEKDYHASLFSGDMAGTLLAQRLRDHQEETFVDFEMYPPSGEPSAFFVEPMIENGTTIGWFVLQLSLDRINNIFLRHEDLLDTGECFLVNRNCQLLTHSRHRIDDGLLERNLPKANILQKFAAGRGHLMVEDYRRRRALTSFEVCNIHGADWLVIAKIDEDEMITRRFRERQGELMAPLIAAAVAAQAPAANSPEMNADAIRVDMDEYRTSHNGRALMTFGVSTCTALLITLPDTVSYLGHASVYDSLYGEGDLDLLGNMFGHLRRFDAYPYQRRDLEFVLIAPHSRSLSIAVSRLLDQGILLSQIRFLHDPTAASATVYHDPVQRATWALWRSQDPGRSARWQQAENTPDLGVFAQHLLGYLPEPISPSTITR